MIKYLLFTSLLVANLCNAQVEHNYVYTNFSTQLAPSYHSKVPDGVTSITLSTENFKTGLFGLGGNKTASFKNTYNSEGLLLTSNMLKDGDFQLTKKNEYNEDGKLLKLEVYNKNGKLNSAITIKRNSDNEYLEYAFFSGNKKLRYFKTWSYNEDGNAKESNHFKGKNKKLKKKWVYEYYEDGQKKQSTLYNSKGKVKQIWSYECKQEGEELSPKKDVSQICKWEESDGKYLLKITQSLNEKGKRYKSVYKYNIADTSLVEAKYFNDENKLYSMGTYDSSMKKPLSLISYKNGNILSETIFKYEKDRLISYSYSYKNKTTKREYEYADNKLALLKTYNKHGELAKTTTYQYN